MHRPDPSRVSLHLMYVTGIAVVASIVLATFEWTPQPHFTEYISNAATLTSLVLSVVAIFYSFVSTQDLSRSLGSIAGVEREITKAQQGLTAAANDIAAGRESLSGSSVLLQRATNVLEEKLGAFHRALANVGETTTAMHASLVVVDTKVSALSDAMNATGHTPAASRDVSLTQHQVDAFLSRSNHFVCLFVYAIVRAYKSSTPVDLVALERILFDTEDKSLLWSLGCFTSLQALGAWTYDIAASEKFTKPLQITSVNPHLAERTAPFLERYIASLPHPPADSNDIDWHELLRRIQDAYPDRPSGAAKSDSNRNTQ